MKLGTKGLPENRGKGVPGKGTPGEDGTRVPNFVETGELTPGDVANLPATAADIDDPLKAGILANLGTLIGSLDGQSIDDSQRPALVEIRAHLVSLMQDCAHREMIDWTIYLAGTIKNIDRLVPPTQQSGVRAAVKRAVSAILEKVGGNGSNKDSSK